MRRNKKIVIEDFIFSLFTIISILMLLVIGSYIVKQNEMDKLTNEFYSKESIHFHIKNKGKGIDLEEDLRKLEKHNFILFEKDIDSDPNIKGVYTSGNIDLPPMKIGRFFKKYDFFNNKKVAVVGKDVKNIEVINGKQYFRFQNDTYEIIGVMGGDFQSRLDYSVYINLDSISGTNSLTNLYVLDSSENVDNIFSRFIDLTNQKFHIYKLDIERKGTENYFTSVTKQFNFIFLFLFSLLCTNILSISYWIYKKRILIAIQHLIGHHIIKIFLSLYKKYILVFLCSYIMGMILFFIFNIENNIEHMYEFNLILLIGLLSFSFIHLVVFFLFMLVYSSKKCLKVLK